MQIPISYFSLYIFIMRKYFFKYEIVSIIDIIDILLNINNIYDILLTF